MATSPSTAPARRTSSERVAEVTGRTHEHDLVFCSRSGPPHVPWLEPDVNDHLEKLAGDGVGSVVIVPIGFVSDHMEVVYDLDTEALATAERLELDAVRVATSGTDPRFVAMVRELLVERAAVERGEPVERTAVAGQPACWDVCAAGLLPQPARTATGAQREGVSTSATGPARSPDPAELRDLAVATAREAGELVVRLRREGVEVAGTKSSDIDIVTEADRPPRSSWSSGCSAPGPTTGWSARRVTTCAAPAGSSGSSTRSTAP